MTLYSNLSISNNGINNGLVFSYNTIDSSGASTYVTESLPVQVVDGLRAANDSDVL